MENNNVSIEKCIKYDFEKVYNAILNGVKKTGGFPDLEGKTVLIKPNVLFPVSPEKAVTTHPVVLSAVLALVKTKNPHRIIVGDSPGISSLDNAGKKTGLKKVSDDYNAEWVEFNEPTLLYNKEGKIQKQFFPAKIVCESDVIISLPKLKTHEMMYFTGAMKNLFGTIPGLNKSRFHFNFPEKDDFATMIVDLNIALKSSYAIMDAITAMEGPGPGSGFPKDLGLILTSPNLLALDITAAEIIGYNPMSIPILRIAVDSRYWLQSEKEIIQTGEIPNNVKPKHFQRVKVLKDTGFFKEILPKSFYKILKNLYVPRPFFSKRKCIKCGKCIKICPAEALRFKNRRKKIYVDIDYEKCIRCYCCHEICPVEAIRIARI